MEQQLPYHWTTFPDLISVTKEFKVGSEYLPSTLWPNSSGYPSLGIDVLEYIKKKYVVAQGLKQEELRDEVDKILGENIQSIIDGNGYSYTIPRRSNDLLQFHPGYGLILKREDNPPVCDLKTNIRKTVSVTCMLWLISECITRKITLTHRGAFYHFRDIFESDKYCSETICDVSCMLACRSSSLCIIPESEGSVFGPLTMKVGSGGSLSCNLLTEGLRIPANLSEISFETDADCIVVVEKKSFFQHLIQTRQHLDHRVIYVTGNGMPDIATKSFLKKLVIETGLQVYAIVDPDPHGLSILFNYAFGSLVKSYDNLGLALPSIMWLYITPSELKKERIPTATVTVKKMSESEIKILQGLEDNKNLEHLIPWTWRFKIRSMIANKEKTSLEALNAQELDYAGRVFIPRKFQNRSKYESCVYRAKLS